MKKQAPSLVFVCMGAVCRSPALKVCFEHLAGQSSFKSHCECRALGPHFAGHGIDMRMAKALKKRGYLGENISQEIEPKDFAAFDYFFGVTHDIVQHLQSMRPKTSISKIYLATHFNTTGKDSDIEDPYYSENGCDLAVEFIEHTAKSIMNFLQKVL